MAQKPETVAERSRETTGYIALDVGDLREGPQDRQVGSCGDTEIHCTGDVSDILRAKALAGLETYHLAWLGAHPWRTPEWFREKLRDGFDVHHLDGDHSSDDPKNLILIEHSDHMMLHGGRTAGRVASRKDDWGGEMIDIVPAKQARSRPKRPKGVRVSGAKASAARAAFEARRKTIWGV